MTSFEEKKRNRVTRPDFFARNRSTSLEGSQVIDFSDNSRAAEDIPQHSSGKLPKKPSAKVLHSADEPTLPIKQQKMVLNDGLVTFHGEIIHGDPDASGIMQISKQEKYDFQHKLIRHFF